MRARFVTAWAAFAVAACSAGAPAEEAKAVETPSLYGQWRIVEVNGAPARGLAPENVPNVSFERGRYGGSSGCNSFGGNGLLIGNRWFGEPAMATQQGCGELDRQESAVFSLLAGGPRVDFQGADGALLRTGSGSLSLRKIGPVVDPQSERPDKLMAGTRWELHALDGKPIDLPGARQPVRLTFEADRWTLETPCATRTGAWRQLEGAVQLDAGASTPRTCKAESAKAAGAIARALAGRLHYVIGPNGELVLTDGTHWATGGSDRTFAGGESQLLAGLWRILSVDGAAPPAAERPAELVFGPGAFGVWDGCMHSEGVAIVTERQLFTHGSGMVTMANCPDDPIRRKINAVVGTRPRIGRTADGGVALMSSAGILRLQRKSERAFGTGVATRLQAGMAFDLLAGRAPAARLTLSAPDRFTVSMACGTFDGRWRNSRSAGGNQVRFGPDRPPPGCGEDGPNLRLYNYFTGDVHVAVGPNRDIALFVSRGEGLPARVSGGR